MVMYANEVETKEREKLREIKNYNYNIIHMDIFDWVHIDVNIHITKLLKDRPHLNEDSVSASPQGSV